MPISAIPSDIDIDLLVRKIRAEVDQRLEQRKASGIPVEVPSLESYFESNVTGSLRLIDNELDALGSQIQRGEPLPAAQTLRNRFGSLLKERLYRFLWWQSDQIKSLVSILFRRGQEETKLLETLAQGAGQMDRRVRHANELALQCSSRINDYQRRLQELESAQLRLQAGEVDRNVREKAVPPAKPWAPAEELREAKERLEIEIVASRQRIDDLGARLEAEISRREQDTCRLEQVERDYTGLRQTLDELVHRMEVGSANNEQVTAQLAEMFRNAEADRAHKDQLAVHLSQLGLFTHQTRATLSIQDRRLALFIEEARRRLPGPFAPDQVQGLVKNHADHQYDSLYMAFEDVFRGSRQEIKTRQSVYLPFLKDRGIGSTTMPILDLGCGRGEWLELLKEHGLESVGVDRNDAMVEQCHSAGLEVMQGDALSYLRSLPDSSMGAITSFHMIEHLPFEVTLHLVDEALRILKPGGVLILETPNPQNILVGAHTFHLDPTHLKPLPSPMVRFFVEARGFSEAQVWELQPYPETVRFPDDGRGIASRLNDYLYGPQDYAVLGVRP